MRLSRPGGAPNPEFARKLLLDGTVVWIFIRIALPVIAALSGSGAGASFAPIGLALGLPGSITLVTICGGLAMIDVLRRRESILLANLGIPLRMVFITGAIPAVVGETVTSLIAAGTGL